MDAEQKISTLDTRDRTAPVQNAIIPSEKVDGEPSTAEITAFRAFVRQLVRQDIQISEEERAAIRAQVEQQRAAYTSRSVEDLRRTFNSFLEDDEEERRESLDILKRAMPHKFREA